MGESILHIYEALKCFPCAFIVLKAISFWQHLLLILWSIYELLILGYFSKAWRCLWSSYNFTPLPKPHTLYTIMKLFCFESSEVKTNYILNQLFSLTPTTVGFSRQEYLSGSPFPSPGDFPEPEIKPGSPALQADSLPSELPGKPLTLYVLEYSWPLSREIDYSIIEKILYNDDFMQSFWSLLSIRI